MMNLNQFYISLLIAAGLSSVYCNVKNNSITGKIVLGKAVGIEKYSFIVQLYEMSYVYIPEKKAYILTGLFICGGSYLKDVWVLTAAHCIVSKSTLKDYHELGDHRRFLLKMGTNNIYDNYQSRNSIKLIIHENYSLEPLWTVNDIGLIKIDSPFMIESNRVTPAPLGKHPGSDLEGEDVVIIGWGATLPTDTPQYQTTPALLQMANTKVVPCTSVVMVPEKLTKFLVCVGPKIPCYGDSGGPLIHKGKLIGVTSFGTGCMGLGAAYTYLWMYRDWMRTQIQAEVRSGVIGQHSLCQKRKTFLLVLIGFAVRLLHVTNTQT